MIMTNMEKIKIIVLFYNSIFDLLVVKMINDFPKTANFDHAEKPESGWKTRTWIDSRSDPKVIKLLLCSTQLCIKFKLLINKNK